MSKINLTEKEKAKIGKQCCNCGKKEDLEYHHIVPLSMGGNNIVSNICCLCYSCHSLIHFGEKKNINHSEEIANMLKFLKRMVLMLLQHT